MKLITHGDGDGICCGAIIKSIKRFRTIDIIFSHPMGLAKDLIGIEEDVIICDIAIDRREYAEVFRLFQLLLERGFNIIYIDHHIMPGVLPSGVTIVHNESVSATELTYRYFYGQFPKHVDHFACIGAICDYMDDTLLIRELLNEYEKRSLYFDAGILSQALGSIGNNYDYKRKLINQFAEGFYPFEFKGLINKALKTSKRDKINREIILKTYQTTRNIAWIENHHSSDSKAAHWIMANSGKVIGIAVNHIKSQGKIDCTIRGRNLIDLRKIIPKIAMELGGSGGGHFNACGCRIPEDKLDLFLERVDEEIEKIKPANVPKVRELIKKEEILINN